jgi:ureidoglycolate lyase
VALRPGVWHHAPFTCDKEYVNTLIVLPERTYAIDCEVYEIPEEDRVEIE